MAKWLIVLPMLYATAAAAAPAWTWVDANGRQHYSDRPVPGARQIDLPGAQGFAQAARSEREAASPAAAASAAAADPALAYRRFMIASPAHEATLWNIGTNLEVLLDIDPGLQPGHRMDAYLDGERVVTGILGTQFTIPNVYRGLHAVQVAITDTRGREIRRTPEITIMVQQTSVQNPNRG